jgi:universal stress protein F
MYKNILVPIDLSHPEQGRKILDLARTLGGPDARLVALFVAGEVPGYVAAELPEHLLQENRAKAAVELKALADTVGAETEVRSGHASTGILEEAEKVGSDLIVVASHRPGLQDYFLGSTAARVVRHSNCAVLVDR